MAQRRLNFEPGHYYHVYNRGAHKLEIFRARKDYHFLLKLVKEQTQKLQISVIAYCLMPNHYHFLFRQNGEREISVLMQAIFNVYSKAFNTQHGHSGTLFEGPFKAIWVDRLEYLLHLCRYIHRNPLEAGLVTHPEQWEYSNYREFVGKRAGVMVDKDFVKEDLGTPAEYESFVMEYVPPEKSEKILHHYLF
jgi:REP element-mobilizing transposase RayT